MVDQKVRFYSSTRVILAQMALLLVLVMGQKAKLDALEEKMNPAV
jgi:hypothetical protein